MQPCQPSILHAIDTTGPGGAETVFLDLAQQLHINGYRNIALIKGPGWVEEQIKKRNITYFMIKPRGFLSLPYYWQIFRLLKSQRVRLVQANLLGSTLTFSIVTLLLNIPLIATLHGRVDVNPNERFIRFKNWLMKLGVNQLVAVSEDLRHFIAERKLFPLNAIITIYNGVHLKRYQTATPLGLRTQLGLPQDSRFIGSIGNIRPAKDYKNLIQAAALIIPSYPKVHFVIAGHPKTDLMAELTQLVASLNLQSNIHFLGFLDNTPGLLTELDLFALSSISEGFSIATLEAMASGVPVIATRCGGPEEIISHQKDGILVAAQIPTELAKALLELLSDLEQCKHLSSQARETVQHRFSLQVMLERYKAIYQTFLNPVLDP
ncbi:MAG: hypothetical protein RL497_1500 [Pseudomonadota bacterium]|jgi:glycosyltransferase involved in cell wall biosynthesis